jgi:hypothetical protein
VGTQRIEAGVTCPGWKISGLASTLIDWLPGNANRLLWLTNWFGPYGPVSSPYSAFLAARSALGAEGDIIDAPVHLFGSRTWADDPLTVSAEAAAERSVLIGLLVMLIPAGWDAWLLSSTSSDAVEIWERNLLFHTANLERAAAAEQVIASYGLAAGPREAYSPPEQVAPDGVDPHHSEETR